MGQSGDSLPGCTSSSPGTEKSPTRAGAFQLWLGSLFPRKSQGWIRSCGSSGSVRCSDICPAQPCLPLLAPPAAPAARGPAAPPTHSTRTLGWLRVGAGGTQMGRAGGSGAGWQTHTYKQTCTCTRACPQPEGTGAQTSMHTHTHMRAQAHTHACTGTYTCMHGHTYAPMDPPQRHWHTQACTHKCTYMSMHAHTGTQTHPCAHAHASHVPMCAPEHRHAHTPMHAHARTHTHTHRPRRQPQPRGPPARLPPPQRCSPRQPPCPGSTCPAACHHCHCLLQARMRGAPAAPPPHCSRAVLCSRTRGQASRDRSTRCRGAASRVGGTP